MVETCVSRNMGIAGNELSIEAWTLPRHVFDATYNSVGDGAFTQLTTLPGKLMIDSGIQTWTNTSPLEARVLLRIQRAYRNWQVSNPNAVQIRDRWTYAVDAAPRDPDTSSVYNGQSGASVDVGANFNATPYKGVYWEWEDGTLAEEWIDPIPSGAQLRVHYRCNLWTPPPWSNNANENNPLHSASVRNVRIQMIAFPVQDTEVLA